MDLFVALLSFLWIFPVWIKLGVSLHVLGIESPSSSLETLLFGVSLLHALEVLWMDRRDWRAFKAFG